MFLSINPFTKEKLFEKPFQTALELSQTVKNVNDAQKQWSLKSLNEKQLFLKKVSEQLLNNKTVLAQTITCEIGKNINEAEAEVQKCIDTLNFYLSNAETLLKTEKTTHNHLTGYPAIQPLGIVFAIMPWNFPIWQCMRVIIPSLIVGNGILIKPAPNAGLTTQLFVDIIHQSLQLNLVEIAWSDVKDIEHLVSNPNIKACTLTGSERAGQSLAMLSSKYLKKCVLELGGSDPFVVLEDVDIEKTVHTAITARIQNNGQSCIASKRFIVPKSIYSTFIQKLIEKVDQINYCDPLSPNNSIGPIARHDLKMHLDNQVQNAVKSGAQIVYQSNKSLPNENFYPITILENLNTSIPEHREEFFGPVFNMYSYNTLEDAIKLANDTPYGLGASIWSNDVLQAEQIALQIEAGNVFINAITRSDAAFPFGGIKNSGFGKELGKEGLLEFAHIKYIQQVN